MTKSLWATELGQPLSLRPPRHDYRITQLDVVASAASVTTAFSRATMPSSVIWSSDRHRKPELLAGPIASAELRFPDFRSRLAAKNMSIAALPAA